MKFWVVPILLISTLARADMIGKCDPLTDYRVENEEQGLDVGMCAAFNPEFRNNGGHCCGKSVYVRRRTGNKARCAPERRSGLYCHEMTDEQRKYTEDLQSGRIPDALDWISARIAREGLQSYCSVNNGFLVDGMRLVPTDKNGIILRTPGRCVDFGTNRMIAAIEWVARQAKASYTVVPEYAGVRLVVGDISAPRGGCLSGRGGRRGHASHTVGQDADIGFLTPKKGKASPAVFHRDFDVAANWWLLKQFFHNPYACVKVVFLDRKLIGKLAKKVSQDQEWPTLRRFIRHVPAHRDHMHVRVGNFPGPPGCTTDSKPELEPSDEAGSDIDLD